MRTTTGTKKGRPSLLSSSLQKRICKLLREGCDIKSACNICDIGERTYHEWKERGEKGERPFDSFFSAASRARDAHKAQLLKRIDAATKADWKAAAWLLERRFPQEF